MADITVSIADGASKTFPEGVRIADVLTELVSGKKRKATLAVRVGERLLDLAAPLYTDTTIEPVSVDSEAGLDILRHSTAHVMALAVKELFGDEVKVAIGPAIEDGFYYDFDRPVPFTPEDFDRIEAKMAEIAAACLPITRTEMRKDEALQLFAGQNEQYKVELLEDQADAFGAERTSALLVEAGGVDTIQQHLTGSSGVQAGQDVHQRRLAGAGSAHEGHEFAAFDDQIDVIERGHGTEALV